MLISCEKKLVTVNVDHMHCPPDMEATFTMEFEDTTTIAQLKQQIEDKYPDCDHEVQDIVIKRDIFDFSYHGEQHQNQDVRLVKNYAANDGPTGYRVDLRFRMEIYVKYSNNITITAGIHSLTPTFFSLSSQSCSY